MFPSFGTRLQSAFRCARRYLLLSVLTFCRDYVPISPVPDPTASSVADRFALILEGLRRATAAAGGRNRSAAPIMLLIWTRLGRTAARFARLAARLGAGALPIVAAAPPDCGLRPVSRRRDPGAPSNGAPVLPRGFAWLLRQVPEAAPFGSQLRHLLSDPEMQALIVAAPQFGRVLRPLCRMLGIAPDEGLALPARAPTRRRVRRTDPPRPATQRPATHRPGPHHLWTPKPARPIRFAAKSPGVLA